MQCCSGWTCPSLRNIHLMWHISYSRPRMLRQRSLCSLLGSSICQDFAALTELSRVSLAWFTGCPFISWFEVGRECTTESVTFICSSSLLEKQWSPNELEAALLCVVLRQTSKISSTATYGQTLFRVHIPSKTGTLVNTWILQKL